jgi:archaeal flagellar protein FlaF
MIMATASLIATAISILLLVVTAYVLIGGTITTAEIVTTAQSDSAKHHEIRLRTSITVTDTSIETNTSTLSVDVKNTGSETIGDFEHMDVYLMTDGVPAYYPYGTGDGKWSIQSIIPDEIHPGQLDPEETVRISIRYTDPAPTWVKIATNDGVYDSAYV